MWRQLRLGRSALLLLAKMSQDSVDNVPILNTGDDLYRSTTAIANFNVDIEYSLESLGLGHRFAPLPRLAGVTNPRPR